MDCNNKMLNLIKITLPEIDLKLSNKIVECIEDVTKISDLERNTIVHILV